MSNKKKQICILITCFNRKAFTLACIGAIYAEPHESCEVSVFLVDDASSDGTAEEIAEKFPAVNIIHGSGSLYWNGGMRLAWETALSDDYDYYLWLNDDLSLYPGWLDNLVAFHQRHRATADETIAVGKVVAPGDPHQVTYGGLVCQKGLSKLRFRRLKEDEFLCDTMNGNCVLIPAEAVRKIGIICNRYTHGGGDIDYGLRARRASIRILQTDFPVGEQPYNTAYDQKNSELTVHNWRFILFSPKGIPWREWLYFCRTFGGVLWPVNFIYRYIKILRLRSARFGR